MARMYTFDTSCLLSFVVTLHNKCPELYPVSFKSEIRRVLATRIWNMAMIRSRPTSITLSDKEVNSCSQRILLSRILERGRSPLVSPTPRRVHSSSEGPASTHSYLVPDSSSFEEFVDCGSGNCGSSPVVSTGKRKRETSSPGPNAETPPPPPPPPPPPSPSPLESLPSSTDTKLAEQLDSITLNFTSFLSPSTWLGPFALASGYAGGYIYPEKGFFVPSKLPGCNPETVGYQIKPHASSKLTEPRDPISTLLSPIDPNRGLSSILGCFLPNLKSSNPATQPHPSNREIATTCTSTASMSSMVPKISFSISGPSRYGHATSPMASSNIITPTNHILFFAPNAVIGQLGAVQKFRNQDLGLPTPLLHMETWFTIPWMTVQSHTIAYPIPNSVLGAIPLRHTGETCHMIDLATVTGDIYGQNRGPAQTAAQPQPQPQASSTLRAQTPLFQHMFAQSYSANQQHTPTGHETTTSTPVQSGGQGHFTTAAGTVQNHNNTNRITSGPTVPLTQYVPVDPW
ncbi:hypothetical protein PABG_02489 [Paracoccidioides brasiliensis Pb03]|nr:hypothetical protein PABG_02489 [Paracoccidioides brasiliensis Pb03]